MFPAKILLFISATIIGISSSLNNQTVRTDASKIDSYPYDYQTLEVSPEFLSKLLSNYNKNERATSILQTPNNSTANNSGYRRIHERPPVIVKVQIYIRNFDFLDDINQELALQITLRQEWTDVRLNYQQLIPTFLPEYESVLQNSSNIEQFYITLSDPSIIWYPDPFFTTEKRGAIHNLIQPNILLRIHPNGKIKLSVRMSLVFNCPMNLRWYPFDEHLCRLQIASYASTSNELRFVWHPTNPIQLNVHNEGRDVEVIQLSHFKFVNFTVKEAPLNSLKRTDSLGDFHSISADLKFDRQVLYYLITIYTPCCILVWISWLTFWFDVGATDARMALGITTVLTMATHIQSILKNTPSVAYTRAVDVFAGFCMIMVSLALLEFTIVDIRLRSSPTYPKNLIMVGGDIEGLKMKRDNNKTPREKAKKVDLMARILFPIIFILFFISYFGCCFTHKRH